MLNSMMRVNGFLLMGLLLVVHVGLVGSPSYGDVWIVEKEWSLREEHAYTRWIENEVHEDLIVPLRKKADCADLAYAFRAIYARKEGLPFLAHDKDGKKYGHFSTDWDHLPSHRQWERDERFQEFMGDLFRDVVSTRTLHYDTYPIAITPESLCPGVMIYEDLVAAHVVTIARIRKDTVVPIAYFESFMPGRRIIQVNHNNGVHLYGPDIETHHSGVVYWKTPVEVDGEWVYLPEKEMPWYSREQYDPEFPFRNKIGKYLNRLAYEQLHEEPFDKTRIVEQKARELIDFFVQRVNALEHARHTLHRLKAKQPSSSLVNQYTTSSMDQELHEFLDRLWLMFGGYGISRAFFEKELERYAIRVDQEYPAVESTLLLEAFMARRYSSDPFDPLEVRWGITFDIQKTQWKLRPE